MLVRYALWIVMARSVGSTLPSLVDFDRTMLTHAINVVSVLKAEKQNTSAQQDSTTCYLAGTAHCVHNPNYDTTNLFHRFSLTGRWWCPPVSGPRVCVSLTC